MRASLAADAGRPNSEPRRASDRAAAPSPSPEEGFGVSGRLRLALWAVGGAIGLALLLWLGTALLFDPRRVERRLAQRVERALGPSRVSIGEVELLPSRLGLAITALRIESRGAGASGDTARPGGRGVVVAVPRLRVTGLAPWSLLGGAPPLETLSLEAPRLSVRSGGTRRGSGLRIAIDGLDARFVDGHARAGRVRILHVEPERPGARLRDTTEVSLVDLSLHGLRIDGGDPSGGRTVVTARLLSVDSVGARVVDVVSGAPSPGRAGARTPVQRLAALPGRARIDSAVVRDGRILYRERRPGLRRAGELLFDRLALTAAPLPIGSGVEGPADSVVMEARARVNAAAPLWITTRFPPGDEEFAFSASGGARGLSLPALNSIFRPLDGVTIQDGRLDTLAFDYRIRGRRARGGLSVVYAGLAVGFEDPETGGRGIAEHLRGFLAGLELNRENLPREGEAYRTGEIAVELEPDDTFFKALWLAVRSGLMDVAGL